MPDGETPWPEINRLLKPTERFKIHDGVLSGFLLSPSSISGLSATLFLCHQLHVEVFFEFSSKSVHIESSPHSLGVIISTRALNRIDLYPAPDNMVVVESGCLQHILDNHLQNNGFELGLQDWIWRTASVTLGELIAQGVHSGLILKKQLVTRRLIEAEFVKRDGTIVRLGCTTPASSIGIGPVPFVWGLQETIGILTSMRFQLVSIPEQRMHLTWTFTSLQELKKQISLLRLFADSWERLDVVLTGVKGQKNYILAEISGSEEEINVFKRECPSYEYAQQIDSLKVLRHYFSQQKHQFQKIEFHLSCKDYNEKIDLVDKELKAGEYSWLHDDWHSYWLIGSEVKRDVIVNTVPNWLKRLAL